MKIRTKFLAAVLAIATAFSCALTASAWDKDTAPAVEFGNSAMPGKTNSDDTATATLTLKSSDFEDVTGAKLTVKLPDRMTLVDASVTGNGSWVEGTDYKVDTDEGTITLVNVFNVGDAAKNLSVYLGLTVSGTFDGEITVSGEFADTNVDKVYKYDGFATGTLTLTRSEKSCDDKDAANTAINELDKEKFFIPAGGVYAVVDGEYVYADKNEDGFDLGKLGDSEVKILTCPLPTGDKKVTTFGNSGKKAADENSDGYENLPKYERYDGIQFGSYAIDSNLTYGTLIIMGDYNAFKNTVASTAGDNEFLNTVATNYEKVVNNSSGDLKRGDAVTFKYGTANSAGERPYITVKMVDRTTAMWEGDSALQYAVRLYKLTEGRSYTGVAYSAGENNYTFSAEIQTKVYNQEGWAE